MSHYDTIRAAINRECPNGGSDALDAALAALAELERAAAEPVACIFNDHGQHSLRTPEGKPFDMTKHVGPLYTAPPPSPVAGWREPTPEECEKISDVYTATRHSGMAEERGRAMFGAVRAVMRRKSEVL